MHNKKLHTVSFLLVIVGGVNWGLVGLLNFDLVQWLFVDLIAMDVLARAVYILVGLAAVYELISHKRMCTDCGEKSHTRNPMSAAGGPDAPGTPGTPGGM